METSKRKTSSNPFEALRKPKKPKSKQENATASPQVAESLADIPKQPPKQKRNQKTVSNQSKEAESQQPQIQSISYKELCESIPQIQPTLSDQSNSAQQNAVLPTTIHSSSLDLLLLFLHSDSSPIPFKGVARIAPVMGACDIFGHRLVGPVSEWPQSTMQISLNFVTVFSPSTSSLLQIQPLEQNSNSIASLGNHVNDSDIVDDYAKETIRLLNSPAAKEIDRSSVVSIAAITTAHNHVDRIEHVHPLFRDMFGRSTRLSNKKTSESSSDIDAIAKNNHKLMPSFSFSVGDGSDGAMPLVIHPSWTHMANTVIADIHSSDSTILKRICAIGSKNSGKSTFCRYLMNRLLSASTLHDIYYIDMDPGQPGCTPPGMVSIHHITSPLLGPPFATIRQPVYSVFVGATSPKHDPDHFVQSVMHLVHVAMSASSTHNRDGESVSDRVPVVVLNTNGWIRGMGWDLLSHILGFFNPTDVVCMGSVDSSNGISINMEANQNESGSANADLRAALQCEAARVWQLEPAIAAPSNMSKPKLTSLSAVDQRALSLTSYFLQSPSQKSTDDSVWSFDTPLCDRVPYRVPFHHVRVQFMLDDVPINQTLHALNGTVVGIIAENDTLYQSITFSQQDQSDSCQLAVVPTTTPRQPSRAQCLGLGIIRSIDTSQNIFHIITPIHNSVLCHHASESTDQDPPRRLLLTRASGVNLPVFLVTHGQEHSRSHVPYTSYVSVEGLGGSVRRNRHQPRRKRNAVTE